MSWTGLPEFVDDTITDYSMPSPTVESKSDDLQNKNPSVTETKPLTSTILSKPDIKFVKATDRTTETKTTKVETAKPAANNNNTRKSMSPRPAIHRPYRPPMRPVRPNMNGA
nr:hypothetical protein [Tanacetum cinerariifolium]